VAGLRPAKLLAAICWAGAGTGLLAGTGTAAGDAAIGGEADVGAAMPTATGAAPANVGAGAAGCGAGAWAVGNGRLPHEGVPGVGMKPVKSIVPIY